MDVICYMEGQTAIESHFGGFYSLTPNAVKPVLGVSLPKPRHKLICFGYFI